MSAVCFRVQVTLDHVYLLSLSAMWRADVPVTTLCFQGDNQLSVTAIHMAHTQTSVSPVTYLFNWHAEAVPALVTHFSHPPVECVCVWACVWCHIWQPGPAPQINKPRVLDKCSHTSTSSFSFLSLTLSLSHHHRRRCHFPVFLFRICFSFFLALFLFCFFVKKTCFRHEFE